VDDDDDCLPSYEESIATPNNIPVMYENNNTNTYECGFNFNHLTPYGNFQFYSENSSFDSFPSLSSFNEPTAPPEADEQPETSL